MTSNNERAIFLARFLKATANEPLDLAEKVVRNLKLMAADDRDAAARKAGESLGEESAHDLSDAESPYRL